MAGESIFFSSCLKTFSWFEWFFFHSKQNFCVAATEKLAKTFTTTLQQLELIFQSEIELMVNAGKRKQLKL